MTSHEYEGYYNLTTLLQFLYEIINKIQIQFLTAHSTQNKSGISVPIKDCIHHDTMALFYDIPKVGRSFTTYPRSGAVLRHTQGRAQFYDIPRLTTTV